MKKMMTIATTVLASLAAFGAHTKAKPSTQKNDDQSRAEKLDLKEYETGNGPNEPVKTFVCRSKPNS